MPRTRTQAMPRVSGLWSAMTRAIEDDANAEREREARQLVRTLRFQTAEASLDDYGVARQPSSV